jgi:acetyl esterase/lipase
MNKFELDASRLIHVNGITKEISLGPPPTENGVNLGGPPPAGSEAPPGTGAPGPGAPPGSGGPGGGKFKIDVPEHYKYSQIPYVSKIVDPRRQIMNIYIPAPYLNGGSVNGYNARTAPVLFHIPGGGFRLHGLPDMSSYLLGITALQHGFIVAAPDIRGCDDHYVDIDGDGKPEYTGKAPAQLVDSKAALRFLRYNAKLGRLPGDFSKVVVTGSSSGGAMTELVATSGNTPRMKKYLDEIGAADAPDNIQVAIPFCGPGDLVHADMTYDWIFGRYIYEYEVTEQKMFGKPMQVHVIKQDTKGLPVMNINYAAGETAYDHYSVYAKMYVDEYLKGEWGLGEGVYVARYMKYLLPAYLEYRAANPEKCQSDYFYFKSYEEYLAKGHGKDPYYSKNAYPSGGYINFDLFRAYTAQVAHRGPPAFDKVKTAEMPEDENALFGDEKTNVRSFTEYGAAHHETGPGTLSAEVAQLVKNQSPLSYIGDPACDCAKHWYIWHGTMDGAVPISMSFDLSEKLKANGISDVVFKIDYNAGHGGSQDIFTKSEFWDWCEKSLSSSK